MATNALPTKSGRSHWAWTVVLTATCLAVFGSIVVVPTAAWPVPIPWKNCGSAGDAISIQQLDASVWPPQAGEPLTVNIKFVAAEPLTKGSVEHVTLTRASGGASDGWLSFQPPAAALFETALLGHYPVADMTPLPMPAGPYSQSLTLSVPRRGPATGAPQVGVDMTGYDATGREVVCMHLTIPIK